MTSLSSCVGLFLVAVWSAVCELPGQERVPVITVQPCSTLTISQNENCDSICRASLTAVSQSLLPMMLMVMMVTVRNCRRSLYSTVFTASRRRHSVTFSRRFSTSNSATGLYCTDHLHWPRDQPLVHIVNPLKPNCSNCYTMPCTSKRNHLMTLGFSGYCRVCRSLLSLLTEQHLPWQWPSNKCVPVFSRL